jgi:hypothetical protein
MNRGPWLEPAADDYVRPFLFQRRSLRTERWKVQRPRRYLRPWSSEGRTENQTDLVTALLETGGAACSLLGAGGTPFFITFSADPHRPKLEGSILGPPEGRPFSFCFCWPRLTTHLLGLESDASESPRRVGMRDLCSSSARAMIAFMSIFSVVVFDFHGLGRETSVSRGLHDLRRWLIIHRENTVIGFFDGRRLPSQ